MEIKVIKRAEKIKIEEKLKEFGIKVPLAHQFVKQAKDKIRIFTGKLAPQDLIFLNKLLRIDSIGLYFAFVKENEFRLSFDASILYGKTAKKFLELSAEEAGAWLDGRPIANRWGEQGYFLIKHGRDILGCGKATKEKILNFVPKERRKLQK